MKKILIISSSLRQGSNSEILAQEAAYGAQDAGHEVEFLSLKDKNINFCKGCLACQKIAKCVIKDDMADMIGKVQNADVLIFSTPIYYYEMSGQLKTFLDRCNPLFSQENNFKDVYLITTSYDDDKNVAQAAELGLQGWVRCFPQSNLIKVLPCGGINEVKEINEHQELLTKAYELGKNI